MAIRFEQIEVASTGHTLYPTIAATGSGQLIQIQSSHGYLQMGSNNTSYAHFQTDRPNFYFNQVVKFDGSIAGYDGNETAQFAIYYDSNDTSYYVNPASNSVMNNIQIEDYISHKGDTNSYFGWGANDTYIVVTNATEKMKINSGGEMILGTGSSNAGFLDFDGTNLQFNTQRNPNTGSFVDTGKSHAHIGLQGANGGSSIIFGTAAANNTTSTTRMRIHGGGAIQGYIDMRAPVFYDSDNTAYYINPTTTGDALKINGSIRIDSTHSGGNLFLYYQHSSTDTANSGTLTGWVSEPGITYSDAGIGANIHQSGPYYGRSINSGYGVYINFKKSNGTMLFKTTTGNSGTSGGQGTTRMTIDASGNVTAATSSRAPIFYDSNDTNYYVNPATGSVLGGTVTIHNDSDSAVSIQNAGTNAVGIYAHAGDELYLGSNNASKMRIHGGGAVESYADFRAPVFYDLNDTAYYLNPNSTSTSLKVAGDIELANDGGQIKFTPGSYDDWEISVDSQGFVIYNTTDSRYDLKISATGNAIFGGNVTATGDVVAYSDERLKTDIKTLDGSKVYEMRGVSFTKDEKNGSGVIAQELEKVAPELVNNDGEYKSVAYGNITGYLIEAIKDLKKEIEECKKQKCNCNGSTK